MAKHFLDSLQLPESKLASPLTRELQQCVISWIVQNNVDVYMGGAFKYLDETMTSEALASEMRRDKVVGYEVLTGKEQEPVKWKNASAAELVAELDHIGRALYTMALDKCRATLIEAERTDDAELLRALDCIVWKGATAEQRLYYLTAMKQLIWQIKQKLAGRRSTNEVFVLFYSGTHGSGKTEWISDFGKALGPFFMTDVDFDLFTDKFRIKAFNRYRLAFLDEMSKAKQAEMAAIKRAITKETIGGRGIFTDNELVMDKNVSFIGAANKHLLEHLDDSSGMRRWVEVLCSEEKIGRDQERWDTLKSIDWLAVWNCVHVEDPSPYGEEFELVVKHQSELETLSDFDSFCENYLETEQGGELMNRDAYEAYCSFMQKQKRAAFTIQVFALNMKARYTLKRDRNPVIYADVSLRPRGE